MNEIAKVLSFADMPGYLRCLLYTIMAGCAAGFCYLAWINLARKTTSKVKADFDLN